MWQDWMQYSKIWIIDRGERQMDTAEFIVQFVGYTIGYAIVLGIIALPIILFLKLIKAITKRCKRIIKTRKRKLYNSPEEWKSDWTWNEEAKLWEHPRSAKGSGAYNFDKAKLDELQGQIVHLDDITFKVAQKPVDGVSLQRKKEPYPINREEGPQKTYVAPSEAVQNKSENVHIPQIIYTYPRKNINTVDAVETEMDYRNSYQKKDLFTRNEWQNYKKLRQIAEVKGYEICPKVRLFDLIEPRIDKKKKLTYRYKIQAKHVDFVICDQDMHVKAVIELDDSSHNNPERMKRDDFVNTILQSVGYTVIHTLYIDNNILDYI